MRSKVEFHNCAQAVMSQAQQHWSGLEAQLREWIGDEEIVQTPLNLQVHYKTEADCYDVRAVLALPSAALTAEALDEDLLACLDRVAELLAEAVRQHRRGETVVGAAMEIVAADAVDIASADSFPASDAPSWTPLTTAGLPLPGGK
ncbi:MAG: hypothetical protein ACRELF_15875 [Gemmataceae bacterium]